VSLCEITYIPTVSESLYSHVDFSGYQNNTGKMLIECEPEDVEEPTEEPETGTYEEPE
jgi:hypothetical protein